MIDYLHSEDLRLFEELLELFLLRPVVPCGDEQDEEYREQDADSVDPIRALPLTNPEYNVYHSADSDNSQHRVLEGLRDLISIKKFPLNKKWLFYVTNCQILFSSAETGKLRPYCSSRIWKSWTSVLLSPERTSVLSLETTPGINPRSLILLLDCSRLLAVKRTDRSSLLMGKSREKAGFSVSGSSLN